jgi:flagellar basal body-associated protein FliL
MAKNEAENQEAADDAEQSSGKGNGVKQLILACALLMGMMVGSATAAVFAAGMLIKPTDAQLAAAVVEDAKVKDDGNGETEPFAFEAPIIVNVKGTDGRRFLKCEPKFSIKKGELSKIEDAKVEFKDLLITLLRRKTMEQLNADDATPAIAREIVESANAKLNLDGAVKKVSFDSFVIQ